MNNGRGDADGYLVSHVAELMSAQDGHTYREFLRVPALSLGLFAAPIGHDDTQQPHAEDEVYLVLGGTAVLDIDGARFPVSPGSIAYVAAGRRHRFVDISDDLRVVVVFAPPERSSGQAR